MRFRISVLITIAAALGLILAGCAGAREGRTPTVSPGPVKTLRPTFTPAQVKPKATLTPVGAPPLAGQPGTPVGQLATPAPVALAPASPTPAPPTPTPAPPSPTPEKASFTVTSPGETNVRSGPGTGYARIGAAQQGQTYEITGKNSDATWWQFAFSGQTAWISGSMVNPNAAAENVQVVANIPALPTSPPAPPAPPPAPTQPPAPAAPPTKYAANEARGIFNNNDLITVRCQLAYDLSSGIAGTLRVMRDGGAVAPDQAFGAILNWANTGMAMENRYLYNEGCKVELRPVVAGTYTAVLVEGGAVVSEPLSFTATGDTREFILVWRPR